MYKYLLVLFIIFPAIFHILASYFNGVYGTKSYLRAIAISICFAIAEYTIKVPLYDKLMKYWTPVMIESAWIVWTIILAKIFEQWHPNMFKKTKESINHHI